MCKNWKQRCHKVVFASHCCHLQTCWSPIRSSIWSKLEKRKKKLVFVAPATWCQYLTNINQNPNKKEVHLQSGGGAKIESIAHLARCPPPALHCIPTAMISAQCVCVCVSVCRAPITTLCFLPRDAQWVLCLAISPEYIPDCLPTKVWLWEAQEECLAQLSALYQKSNKSSASKSWNELQCLNITTWMPALVSLGF